MTVSAIDWTSVLSAFIVALPALIAAIASLRVHRKVGTPSGTSIGKQVENALHTALANNYRLRSLNNEVEPPTQGAVRREEARAADASKGNGEQATERGPS